MKKITTVQILAAGAAIALTAVLTLSGCGKKKSGETVGDSTASAVSSSSVQSESEEDIPVTDQDLPLEECFQLGNYKNLELTKTTYTVSDEMVNTYMTSGAEVEEVTSPGAAVENGDTVNIAFEGEIDGESFEGGTSTSYDLVIGSGTFIDGFEDGVIGMKKGETKDLNLKFPDDYGEASYAGKDVVFHVTVNKISRPETDNSDEAKAKAREELEAQYRQYSETELLSNAWAKVRDNSKYLFIRQKDIDAYKDAAETMLKSQLDEQSISMEEYLENQGLTEDQYNDNLAGYAKELAKEGLMIEALEKAENMSTDDADYTDALQTMADQNSMTVEELQNQLPELVIKQYVETMRLSQKIVDYAKVTEKTADAEDAVGTTN